MSGSSPEEMAARIRAMQPAPCGTLRVYGDWSGRPYDNLHLVVGASVEGGSLVLEFDSGEILTATRPNGRELADRRLRIARADHVRWEWFSMGSHRFRPTDTARSTGSRVARFTPRLQLTGRTGLRAVAEPPGRRAPVRTAARGCRSSAKGQGTGMPTVGPRGFVVRRSPSQRWLTSQPAEAPSLAHPDGSPIHMPTGLASV